MDSIFFFEDKLKISQKSTIIINPLNMAAGYIEQIGKGELPEKITDEYKGDFDDIKNSINSCIDGLGGLVEGAAVLGKMAVNDFDSKVEGDYLGIFNEIADSVNKVCDTINGLSGGLIKISEGNLEDLELPKSVGKQSGNDKLTPSIITLIESIKSLVDETGMLSGEAVEGKLSTRGEAGKFKGEYAKVIEGINSTLDAVVEPINEASAVLHEMAAGNLQSAMEGNYRGDHAAIKTALNETIGNMRSYVSEISEVLAEISEGNLNLAARSAAAARETTELIEGSINKVQTGTKIANETAAALGEIVTGIDKAASLVGGIATASNEQASGIAQINKGIEQVAQVVQNNSATAEESFPARPSCSRI